MVEVMTWRGGVLCVPALIVVITFLLPARAGSRLFLPMHRYRHGLGVTQLSGSGCCMLGFPAEVPSEKVGALS